MKKKSNSRKTSTTPTKIYSYGCLQPSDTDKMIISDQLWLAHLYRNKLVEIERNRRTKYRALRASLSPVVEEIEKENDDIDLQITNIRNQISLIKDPRNNEKALPRHLREDNDEFQKLNSQIDKLKKKKKPLAERIKSEFNRIEKEHFSAHNRNLAVRKIYHGLDLLTKSEDKLISEQAKLYLADFTSDTFDITDAEKWLSGKIHSRTKTKINQLANSDMKDMQSIWVVKNQIDIDAHDANIKARESCGLFFGTYLKVEEAASASFKMSPFLPKFVKYDGRGLVVVQTKNISLKEAESCRNDILKIEYDDSMRMRNKNQRAAIVHLRLSHQGQLVYISLPFIMHRSMPDDSIIKWVWVKVDKIGTRPKYDIQFSIESEVFKQADDVNCEGMLAVNLGWRILDNGDIRIATTWDGSKYEFINLPNKVRDAYKFSEMLLGYSDDHFNLVKKVFSNWVKNTELPNYTSSYKTPYRRKQHLVKIHDQKSLAEIFETSSKWKSHKKLARAAFILNELYNADVNINELWRIWKNDRFSKKNENERDLFDTFENISNWLTSNGINDPNTKMAIYLEWWRRKDCHLTNWARNIQTNNKRHIHEIYRCAVARWRDKYEKIIFPKWDKRKTSKTPELEDDTRSPQELNAGSIRQICGVGILESFAKEKFQNDYLQIDAKNISQNHFDCGGSCKTTLQMIEVWCEKCGRQFNQDINAVMHLWSSEQRRDVKTIVTSRVA